MRKVYVGFFALLLSLNLLAQAPERFNYQAVARNSAGNLLINQNVSFRISIIQGSIFGASVYVETHNLTTNQFGMANFQIGSGTVIVGSMSAINWSNNAYFVKVELDATGGSNFIQMGTSQLVSVPYALNARTADTALVALNAAQDGDTSATNEIQTLSIVGDTIKLSNNGGNVILSADVPQNLSIVNDYHLALSQSADTINLADAIPMTKYTKVVIANSDLNSVNTLNNTPVKILDLGSFTKLKSYTAIEASIQCQFSAIYYCIINNCAKELKFELRIDDVLQTTPGFVYLSRPDYDDSGNGYSNLSLHLQDFFEGIAAGTHTVSLWATGYDLASVAIKPSSFNNTGTLLVKETW